MSTAEVFICGCSANFATRKALSSHEASCTVAQNGGQFSSLFKKRKLVQERARVAKRQAREGLLRPAVGPENGAEDAEASGVSLDSLETHAAYGAQSGSDLR